MCEIELYISEESKKLAKIISDSFKETRKVEGTFTEIVEGPVFEVHDVKINGIPLEEYLKKEARHEESCSSI